MKTTTRDEQTLPVIFTIPSLGWRVIDTAQGACFEFEDGSHSWPTPRERLIIEAFQNYVEQQTTKGD